MPRLSADGTTLYYLSANAERLMRLMSGDLHSVNLKTGQKEQLLPGIPIGRYSISHDVTWAAFTRIDKGGSLWTWSLDRRSPPQEVLSSGADSPIISSSGEIFFVGHEGEESHVLRMNRDGSERRKAIPDPVEELISISPDSNWLVAATALDSKSQAQQIAAYSLKGESPVVLCRVCSVGTLEITAPIVNWSLDQKVIYVSLAHQGTNDEPKTVVIPLTAGRAFPTFHGDLVNEKTLAQIPGTRITNATDILPGPTPRKYAIWRTSTQSNLYRVQLP